MIVGFFIPGFPKLNRFQEHHDKLLSKFLPKLKKHMDKFTIHSSLYTLKWFFQCFLDRVSKFEHFKEYLINSLVIVIPTGH